MKKRDTILFLLGAVGVYFLFFRRTPAPPPVAGAVMPTTLTSTRRMLERYDR